MRFPSNLSNSPIQSLSFQNSFPHLSNVFFPSQDELVAVSEKAVLRVPDLLDWIADPSEVSWDRGVLGIPDEECKQQQQEESSPQFDKGLVRNWNSLKCLLSLRENVELATFYKTIDTFFRNVAIHRESLRKKQVRTKKKYL